VVTANDYSPFGSLLSGRNYNAPNRKDYTYGFNGKMNDNEVKGEGNQQDYGMRIYDPRLGRFLSEDPITKKYPELTPYQFASNTPIQAIDLDGLEASKLNQIASDISDFIDNLFSFKSEVSQIKEGLNNIGEGAAKQAIGPWDNHIFNEENPGLAIAYRKAEGQVQGLTGIVQLNSGVQGISAKLETIATDGLFGASLIKNSVGNSGKVIIKTPTKLTTNVSIKPKELTIVVPESPPLNKPNFIVDNSGQVFPVPKGAKGPTPVINPSGKQTGVAFTGGQGGANGKVATMRIMNPTLPKGKSPGYPNGYIKYENAASPKPQGVNPQSGQTAPNAQSHYPINNIKE
jgi:RHS repeat-associated protein